MHSEFSKTWFRWPDHNSVRTESGGSFELSPSFPPFPCITFAVRVFSLPFASLVADSLEGHSLLSPSGRFLFRYSLRGGVPAGSCRHGGREDAGCHIVGTGGRECSRVERLLRRTCFGLGEPAATELLRGDTRHVRLDVEDRSSIEHVDAADVQQTTVAAEQFDNRERNGIGAAG
jgi:hypothetical protein